MKSWVVLIPHKLSKHCCCANSVVSGCLGWRAPAGQVGMSPASR